MNEKYVVPLNKEVNTGKHAIHSGYLGIGVG